MPSDAMEILRALATKYAIKGAGMMEIAPFTDSLGEGVIGGEKTMKMGAGISAFLINELVR